MLGLVSMLFRLGKGWDKMRKILILMMALTLFLTACGETAEYAATVGKGRISLSEMKFYLDSVKQQMAGTELSSDEDWQTKEIEGRKAIDLAKERATDTAVKNLAYIEVGKAVGIKLTSADRQKVSENKNQFVSQFQTAQRYIEFLQENNIKDSFIDMLCESMIYSSLLTEKVRTEQPVGDEEASAYFAENQEDLTAAYRHAKHILILTKNMDTGAEMSPEAQEAAKQKAEGLYKRALDGEDFDSLMAEYSEDPGLKTQPDGYVFGDGEMVPQFQDETDSLPVGGIGLVKSDFGYHIILRLPLEEKDMSDRIKSMILSDRLEEQMDNWEKEHNIVVEINDEVIAKL